MRINQINNQNSQNKISYKSVKVHYKDCWHPKLLNEILQNKEIEKAANFLEKRNSSMEMWIRTDGIKSNKTYSVSCTYDRRYKPHGENCNILERMSLSDALNKLKNFNSRDFIAFVKKTERTNTDKLEQIRILHNPKSKDKKEKHKNPIPTFIKYFGF